MLTHLYLLPTFIGQAVWLRADRGLLRSSSSSWGEEALAEIRGQIGKGESEGNNIGPYLDLIRRDKSRKKPQGAWCAYEVSFCLEESWWRLYPGKAFPFALDTADGQDRARRGARRLWAACAKAGATVKEPRPGDIVLWSRGREPWQGHIGIVSRVDADGTWRYIAGNEGKFPALVREHKGTTHRLIGFARLPAGPE